MTSSDIQLYPFQQECVDKLGAPEIVSRLIGDEMGLGKTVEVLVIDAHLRHASEKRFGTKNPTLIVAPLSVHRAWAVHVGKISPQATVCVVDKRDRSVFVKAALKKNYDYYICHYEGLRLMPELNKVAWFHIIADEVHRIKDVPLDTLVLTPTGWTRMGAIHVGDRVIGSNGYPTKVVAVYPQGTKDVYKVSLTDGSEVEAGPEHLWTVRNARGDWKTIPTLEVGTRLSYGESDYGRFTYLPSVAPVQYEPVELPVEPYALGLLLGDGEFATYGAYENGMISFTSADGLESALPWTLSLTQRGKGTCKTYDLLGARKDIRALGLLGKKSHEKFIPPQYLLASPAARLDLLCGLMDTDGWLNSKRSCFGSTSIRLVHEVRELVLSLGGTTSKIRTDNVLRKGATQLFHQVELYLPEGMCPFRLERKASLWKPGKKLTRSVKAVEFSRSTETQCIEVDAKDGLFVVHGYILTHNSRKAQQTRALKALETRFKSGLSGTPADNKPQDLWSVVNWLYPRVFTSYWRFVQRFCEQELTQSRGGTTFRKVVGVKRDNIGELHAQMEPWYIRRLKENVLPDLPEKYYTTREVDLLPSQRKTYNQMRKEMIAWVGEHEDQPLVAPVVIAQLVRLQQFALASPIIREVYRTDQSAPGVRRLVPKVDLVEPSSKLDELCAIVDELGDESLIVFTQSRSMVDLIAARLSKEMGRKVGKYKGATPQKERDWVVDAFQDGRLNVFAGTIAAGGESITLTRASTVVFLDRHWNPARNKQAEDRAHRIGQKSAVQVIDIVAKNTVDLGRMQQIAGKWNTLKILLGDKVDSDKYIRSTRSERQDLDEAISDALRISTGE